IACAVIRLRLGHAALGLAQVTEYLLARGLSKRKLPERLVIAADLPRTASGKVLKRALRERLAGEGGRAPPRDRPGAAGDGILDCGGAVLEAGAHPFVH